jgi:hypothetical protein
VCTSKWFEPGHAEKYKHACCEHTS